MTTYTCNGSVRGNCGEEHETARDAVECIRRDQAGCKSQGGYSDREIDRADGQPLTEGDQDALAAARDA